MAAWCDFVGGKQRASELGPNAKHLKIVAGDGFAQGEPRPVGELHRAERRAVGQHVGEDLILCRELEEVGHFDVRVQMRLYHADFSTTFHDVRGGGRAWTPLLDPDSYVESQRAGRALLEAGSNGIIYDSVRHAGGTCLACFRPRLVSRVRVAAHYEYAWSGGRTPGIRRLAARSR